ncbi:ANTAR domain-containing response regulator [Undibacterium oligocarboniphilum]|uniref:ANTAR domain-containing protein n=1 Tax=Undibacterium oligocarboniphilum TaxID=666702 RepID=A0A850QBF8_9BURK|nr:ANTAR domain-containing protein [Undibacterium oligocarboniphilum]MBC3868629.1 ANTAR domain-containing protein [Undibacterium oligocarboniphilum]NVO76609.1 ANTAR domain-containing protein [Undibacterium oligocarboniphilum]
MKPPPNGTPSSSPGLRIVVVNTLPPQQDEHDVGVQEQLARSRTLRIGLLEAGYNIVASIPGDIYLIDRIAQLQPDMIIIDAESDARDVLEHMVVITSEAPRPIVLFTEDGNPSQLAAAMRVGVSAYVVAGLQSERIKPVLDVAIARFEAEQKLRNELSDTKARLAERKTIERAKGYLMERHQLSENEAYQRLRKQAMEKNLKLIQVAERILDIADLLG